MIIECLSGPQDELCATRSRSLFAVRQGLSAAGSGVSVQLLNLLLAPAGMFI